MKKLLSLFLLIVLIQLTIRAQGDLDGQEKIFYRNERTVAFSLNSNGFGVGYREGMRIDYLNKKLLEGEISILKHPKELKLSNPYVQAGNSFVFGKLNNAISIRGGLGRQHELYKKKDLGGISIKYFFTGGPSLVFTKPIYYNVLYPASGNTYELRQEKFDIDIHNPSDIFSRASFFKGIKELGLIPGAYIKGGFNFEYSKEDKIIHALELGLSVEGYFKKIPIMASEDNNAIFINLFVSYRLGYVVNPFDPESGKISNFIFRRQK